MKWLVLVGFVLTAAGLGTARFGGWLHAPSVWLDVSFITSAAAAVGMAVSMIIVRLHGAARRALLDGAEPPGSGGLRSEK